MSDNADDSGVVWSSLYLYFSNRVELIIAIGARKWKEFIDARDQTRVGHMTVVEALKWYRDEACSSMLRGGYSKRLINLMRENFPEIQGPLDFER